MKEDLHILEDEASGLAESQRSEALSKGIMVQGSIDVEKFYLIMGSVGLLIGGIMCL